MQRPDKKLYTPVNDNTYDWLLNYPSMDWRRLLQGFAKQSVEHMLAKAWQPGAAGSFVNDYTLVEKTGATIEFII